MKFSDIALKVLAAKESGIIKTNAEFWSKCPNRREFDEKICKAPGFSMTHERLYDAYSDNDSDIGIIYDQRDCSDGRGGSSGCVRRVGTPISDESTS